jgi:putative phosphoesterase
VHEPTLLKVATLFDIHGNLPALEAVLAAVATAQVDCLVVGGDIVSGPMPRATLDRLMALEWPAYFIRGNADRQIVDAFDGKDLTGIPGHIQEANIWTARQLDPIHRDFLAGQPESVTVNIHSLGPVLFCHAVPGNDEVIITRVTPQERIRPWLEGAEQAIIVSGHTHMPFDRQVGRQRWINAGSVGMPYGEPGAYWALLGPAVSLMRTMYDLKQAAKLIQATAYPQAQDFAHNNVLHPPTEEEAIEVFERQAAEQPERTA